MWRIELPLCTLATRAQVPRGEQDRCPLGKGNVPLRQIINTLDRAGYDGYLDVELLGESVEAIDYRALLTQSRDFMSDVLNAASQ